MNYKSMIIDQYEKMIFVKFYLNRKLKKDARLNLHVEQWSQIIENGLRDEKETPVMKTLHKDKYFPYFDSFFCESHRKCDKGKRGFYGRCPLIKDGEYCDGHQAITQVYGVWYDVDDVFTEKERLDAAWNIMTLFGEM